MDIQHHILYQKVDPSSCARRRVLFLHKMKDRSLVQGEDFFIAPEEHSDSCTPRRSFFLYKKKILALARDEDPSSCTCLLVQEKDLSCCRRRGTCFLYARKQNLLLCKEKICLLVQEQDLLLIQEQEEWFSSCTRRRIPFLHRTATFLLYKKKIYSSVPYMVPDIVSNMVPLSKLCFVLLTVYEHLQSTH